MLHSSIKPRGTRRLVFAVELNGGPLLFSFSTFRAVAVVLFPPMPLHVSPLPVAPLLLGGTAGGERGIREWSAVVCEGEYMLAQQGASEGGWSSV